MTSKKLTSIQYHQFCPEFMEKWDEALQISNLIYPLLLTDYEDKTKEIINIYLKQYEDNYLSEPLNWSTPFTHPISLIMQRDYCFILSFLQKLHAEKMLAEQRRQKKDATVTISKDEYDDLMWELEGYPDIVMAIYKFYKIDSLKELPKVELYNAKREIRRIKKNEEL